MKITPHPRIGPTLFILLGMVAAFLGYWWPLWQDRQYRDLDTRIGFLVAGFAPLTTGCAALAAYGYYRLWRTQRTSPTGVGQGLLVLFLIPALFTVLTGLYLAPIAMIMLPDFIKELLRYVLPF